MSAKNFFIICKLLCFVIFLYYVESAAITVLQRYSPTVSEPRTSYIWRIWLNLATLLQRRHPTDSARPFASIKRISSELGSRLWFTNLGLLRGHLGERVSGDCALAKVTEHLTLQRLTIEHLNPVPSHMAIFYYPRNTHRTSYRRKTRTAPAGQILLKPGTGTIDSCLVLSLSCISWCFSSSHQQYWKQSCSSYFFSSSHQQYLEHSC